MLFAKTQEILVGGRTRFGFLRFDPGTWQGEFLIIPPGFVFSAFFARGQELY
jgi:hypothetical protein